MRERGPKGAKASDSPLKQKTSKNIMNNQIKSPGLAMKKGKSEGNPLNKNKKPKGEVSFIIEEMMDKGIAKGDISTQDGTGTDNMTCVII